MCFLFISFLGTVFVGVAQLAFLNSASEKSSRKEKGNVREPESPKGGEEERGVEQGERNEGQEGLR